jgi:C4-dicarboxylate-specific signal transduction histidine kinase
MRKISKVTLLPIVAVLLSCALLLAKVLMDVTSEVKEDQVVRQNFTNMRALSHGINEDVLRSRSFMLQTYDPIVLAAEELKATCDRVKSFNDLPIMKHPSLQESIFVYCRTVEEKMGSVERFKSSNSLFRNSIRYMPLIISQFKDRKTENQARRTFSEILLHGTSNEEMHAEVIRNEVTKLLEMAPASQQPVAEHFARHTGIILSAWEKRKKAEQDVLFSGTEEAHHAMVDVYESWTASRSRSDRIQYSIWILLCAGLGVAVAIMFRGLQTSNATLEEKVFDRTKELREKQQMLVQSTKISALGEMAGGIAHEINTPLGSIMLNAEMMLELIDKETQPEIASVAQSIIKTVNRISKIILGLRRFSRDTGQDCKVPAEINDLIADTLNFCQEKIRMNSVKLTVSVPEGVSVNCVPEQISQVLLNLITNAYDACSDIAPNERFIAVEGKVCEGGKVHLSVTNAGPAIPESVQAKLMQPFFTTKPVGKGTGLGLSISKGIIEEHGGSLTYDKFSPTPRFVIELPALPSTVESITPEFKPSERKAA